MAGAGPATARRLYSALNKSASNFERRRRVDTFLHRSASGALRKFRQAQRTSNANCHPEPELLETSGLGGATQLHLSCLNISRRIRRALRSLQQAKTSVMVRAEGLEPSRGYPQRIFVPATAFAAARGRLWSGLSLHLGERSALGAARLVSTPSLIGLGSGLPSDRFPRL